MTEINLQAIKKQIKQVIEYSQGIDDLKLDTIINKWYDNKQDFINLFKGKLIYEVGHIEVDIEEQERREKLGEFIDENYTLITQAPGLYDFIKLNSDNFFSNATIEKYCRNDIIIQPGTKISKAFKFFVQDPEQLDKLQTAASRLIQAGKINGILCFSVHPLDYLSSSENTFNWRSCHALDGQYRAGNLSYMLDSSTICCYIKSEHKPIKLPRFPNTVLWNNKKWRMLLFCSDRRDALFAGRQYPFFSKEILNNILLEYDRLDRKRDNPPIWGWGNYYTQWSNWHNKYLTGISSFGEDAFSLPDRYVFINGIDKLDDVVEDAPNSLHYNDLLHSSYYTKPYYAWQKTWRSSCGDLHPHFTIGSSVPCLCCGEHKIKEPSVMLCEDCYSNNDYVRCSDCGVVIRADNARWIDRAQIYVCEDCYRDNYMECPCCGEMFHSDDMIWCEEADQYYCQECYGEYRAEN